MTELLQQGYIGNLPQLVTLRRVTISEGKAKGSPPCLHRPGRGRGLLPRDRHRRAGPQLRHRSRYLQVSWEKGTG